MYVAEATKWKVILKNLEILESRLSKVQLEKFYHTIEKASFIRRPNRFILEVEWQGEVVRAHLPNPGRLWELLFPGVTIYMVKHEGEGLKTAFRVVGIERDGIPIMMDTNYSNDIAEWLVTTKQIPGWEDFHVVKREHTIGHSRFDLLLENDKGEPFLVEVKSCTLFGESGAMFPDAITERGRKHVLELVEMAQSGMKCGILFLVHWGRATWFLPDYHTDLAFSQTFLESAPHLDWKAMAISWDESFTVPTVVGACDYPEEILRSECHDRGDYMIVLSLEEEKTIEIGSKGHITFPAGYYVYVGSAKANLTKRMDHHKRKRKKMHWHMDYFRQHAAVVATVPIRTSDDLEHDIAAAVSQIADWFIPHFGSSDCHCESHLYGFKENPVHVKAFMDVVEHFRMNRLEGLTKKSKK